MDLCICAREPLCVRACRLSSGIGEPKTSATSVRGISGIRAVPKSVCLCVAMSIVPRCRFQVSVCEHIHIRSIYVSVHCLCYCVCVIVRASVHEDLPVLVPQEP